MVEDILVKVENFIYPVDFVVIDTEPVASSSSQIPIILGRPFLATINATINSRNGLMNITFGNMSMDINVFSIPKNNSEEEEKPEPVNVASSMEQEPMSSQVGELELQALNMN